MDGCYYPTELYEEWFHDTVTPSPPSSALSHHLTDEEPPSDAYYTAWAGSWDEDHMTTKMPSAASTSYASLPTIPSDSDYSTAEVCSTEYVTAELCVSERLTEYVTAELCKSLSMRSMKSSIGLMPSEMGTVPLPPSSEYGVERGLLPPSMPSLYLSSPSSMLSIPL